MDNSANKSNRSTATTLLSEKRAKEFVVEKLGIDRFDEKFKIDNVSLLNEIITAWQNRIPFQTASNMASAADPSERKIPTMEDSVSSILSLCGGTCWTHNTVMHMVLNALGYEVILGMGRVFNRDAKNHAMVFVKNLTAPNSRHVVEVGFASVSPNAICLDFETESEVLDNIYTPQKYIKYEGWFVRCHKSTPIGLFDLKLPVVKLDGWDLVCYFKVQEYTYDQVQESIEAAYFSRPDSFVNRDIMITILSDGKYVFLYNRKLKVEKSPGGEVEIVMLEKDEQLLEAIFRHFPMIPKEEVRSAVDNWRKLKSGLYKKPDGENDVSK